MSEEFKVSVIIPVYNAAQYVSDAVNSCLKNPEVAEILLIEDGSPDDALRVCKELQEKHRIVKLLQHPNGENRGAGESRNLGIENATYPYIAFLDADDLMADDRFKKAAEVFANQPDAEGVYEAIAHFSSEKGVEKKLFTIRTPKISPNRLFYLLLRGTYGHFHTNGITIKSSVFRKCGLFETRLRLHQDAELWLRLAYYCRLYPGELKQPVALVRRHPKNRIIHANPTSKILMWQTVNQYFKRKASLRNRLIIAYKLARFQAQAGNGNKFLYLIRNFF